MNVTCLLRVCERNANGKYMYVCSQCAFLLCMKSIKSSWIVAGGETNPVRWATGFAEEGGLGSLVGFCSWRKAWVVGGKWWITMLIGMMWTAVSLYFICTYFNCSAIPFVSYRYVVCTVFILNGIVCVGGVQGIPQYSCI